MLLNNPTNQIFDKAQSQIFHLMKYDSYPRFLKSDLYKDCIRNEMEGKATSYSKNSEEKPTHLVRNSSPKFHFLEVLIRLD